MSAPPSETLWENLMRYSKKLLVAFQNQYKSTFGEDINLQVAEAELNKLARLIEAITTEVSQKNNKG